jgi:hypothetical protein
MTPNNTPQTDRFASQHPDMPPRPEAGRGPNGRFAKGNAGGPGNPFARKVAAFRQEFMAAVSKEDLAVIVRSLIDKAKQGDVAAARIVLQYTLGKPAATVDPDRLDEMEWQQWQREAVPAEEIDPVFKGFAAPTVSALARTAVPVVQEKLFDGITGACKERVEREREEAERQKREEERRAERKARRAEKQAEAGEARAASVSPMDGTTADQGGQRVPEDDEMDEMAKLLRMICETVTKREETARRAANGFDD